MPVKICITHGFHPNELTEPYAKETAAQLRQLGYDVSVHEIPLGLTGWGIVKTGLPVRTLVEKACCNSCHIPDRSADLVLDFHASAENVVNKDGLTADMLEPVSLYDQGLIEPCGGRAFTGIGYAPWFYDDNNPPHENGYWIEVPNVFIPVPIEFTSYLHFRYPRLGFEVFRRHFMLEADEQATLAKYPPEVIGMTIALCVDADIVPNIMGRRQTAIENQTRAAKVG